jgi:GH15 family glucan-1,4-alpha-glucosidase
MDQRSAATSRQPDTDTTYAQPELRDYAALGDGRTIALVNREGRIDWLPIPDLDSLPVFALLIDGDSGGCIELCPEQEFSTTRRYVGPTNVLETVFTTDAGSVRVTDALVTGVAGRLPWAELARRVEGIDGSVRMRWAVRPGTMLRTASPWLENNDGSSFIRIGQISVGVTGKDHGAKPAGDGCEESLTGAFTTDADSRHLLVVAATHDEPLHIPDPDNVMRGVDRTIAGWEAWSREFSYDGPWSEQVQRSALVLKLLIFAPSGAIAAAATTSLPESPVGGKNWDYRYAWVRDAAYSVQALVRFGLREETHAAYSWLLGTIRRHSPDLQVFYRLNGELPGELSTYEAAGWHDIGPVVAGNDARNQLQLGIYGDLFGISRAYVDAGNILDTGTGRLLAAVADRTCDIWRHRDSGMWELNDLQHYTSSKMGCWQALDAAVHLADLGQIPGSSARWRSERERIRAWIEEHGWSEDVGAYIMHPGSTALDTSVLLHAPSGFDRGERMNRTIDALRRELARGALLYRYSGMQDQEHPFTASSFWLVSALACVGRVDEAVELMDELVTLSNDVGLYSEMTAEDGAFWGNLPQGLSHLALINAAMNIEELSA